MIVLSSQILLGVQSPALCFNTMQIQTYNNTKLAQIPSNIMGACLANQAQLAYQPQSAPQITSSPSPLTVRDSSLPIAQTINPNDIKIVVQSAQNNLELIRSDQEQSPVSSQKASSFKLSDGSRKVHRNPENASEEEIHVYSLPSETGNSQIFDQEMGNEFNRLKVQKVQSTICTLNTSISLNLKSFEVAIAEVQVRPASTFD